MIINEYGLIAGPTEVKVAAYFHLDSAVVLGQIQTPTSNCSSFWERDFPTSPQWQGWSELTSDNEIAQAGQQESLHGKEVGPRLACWTSSSRFIH